MLVYNLSKTFSDVRQSCPWGGDVRHAGLRGALHLRESERPPLLVLASVFRGCQGRPPTPGTHTHQYQKLHSHPRPRLPGETQCIAECMRKCYEASMYSHDQISFPLRMKASHFSEFFEPLFTHQTAIVSTERGSTVENHDEKSTPSA